MIEDISERTLIGVTFICVSVLAEPRQRRRWEGVAFRPYVKDFRRLFLCKREEFSISSSFGRSCGDMGFRRARGSRDCLSIFGERRD